MRACLLICAVLLAAPAAAQETDAGAAPARRPLQGLRGALPPAPPAATPAPGPSAAAERVMMSPVPAPVGPPPLTFAPSPGDPARCRLTCAQNYYFCAADDDPETCAPAWGQCRAACGAPRYAIPRVAGVR